MERTCFPMENRNTSMIQRLEHMDVDDLDGLCHVHSTVRFPDFTAPLTYQALPGAMQRSWLVACPRQEDSDNPLDD